MKPEEFKVGQIIESKDYKLLEIIEISPYDNITAVIISKDSNNKYSKIVFHKTSVIAKQCILIEDVKDTFKLPERWAVKDCIEISKWASDTFKCLDGYNPESYLHIDMEYYPKITCYAFLSSVSYAYTEITFEQWKEHYMKEDMKKNEPLPRTYVVLTDSNSQVNEVMKTVYDKNNYVIHSYCGVIVRPNYTGNHLCKNEYSYGLYEQITFNEWKQRINKETMKEEVVDITRKQLKSIYDIACGGWKEKINCMGLRTPFENTVYITQKEIDEMFKAADKAQTVLLESIFGPQIKKFDENKIYAYNNGIFIRFLKKISDRYYWIAVNSVNSNNYGTQEFKTLEAALENTNYNVFDTRKEFINWMKNI